MKNLNSYLDRLTSMRMRPEVLQHAVDILKAVPQIQTELENPATSRMKQRISFRKFSRQSPDSLSMVWLKMVPLDLWMRS